MPRKPSLKKQQEMKVEELEKQVSQLQAMVFAVKIDSLETKLKYREEQAAHIKTKLLTAKENFKKLIGD